MPTTSARLAHQLQSKQDIFRVRRIAQGSQAVQPERNNASGNAVPSSTRAPADAVVQLYAARSRRAPQLPDGASRLAIVATLAKAALPEQRADLHEGVSDGLRRNVREAEHLEPRRVVLMPSGLQFFAARRDDSPLR